MLQTLSESSCASSGTSIDSFFTGWVGVEYSGLWSSGSERPDATSQAILRAIRSFCGT